MTLTNICSPNCWRHHATFKPTRNIFYNFVKGEHLGSGFESNTTLKVVGPTRELERNLNDESDQGKALRSRYQAIISRNTDGDQQDFYQNDGWKRDYIIDSNVRLTARFRMHRRGKSSIFDNTIPKTSRAPKPIAIKGYTPKRKPPTVPKWKKSKTVELQISRKSS